MNKYNNCGFRIKVYVCSFKPEDCNAEKCDMHDIVFKARAIKAEMKVLDDKIAELVKEVANLKRIKQMLKLEKNDKDAQEVADFKKKAKLLEDLSKGKEYLKKAYMFCKRAGL